MVRAASSGVRRIIDALAARLTFCQGLPVVPDKQLLTARRVDGGR